MRRTSPYSLEVPASRVSDCRSVFGLIGGDQTGLAELAGYEVTVSGEVVVPWFSPQTDTRERDAHPIDSLE